MIYFSLLFYYRNLQLESIVCDIYDAIILHLSLNCLFHERHHIFRGTDCISIILSVKFNRDVMRCRYYYTILYYKSVCTHINMIYVSDNMPPLLEYSCRANITFRICGFNNCHEFHRQFIKTKLLFTICLSWSIEYNIV